MIRRRRDENGAVALVVALVVCFLILPLASLAVDIGMQRVARRDVQVVADTTALDMARTLASGTTPTDALAATSASRSAGVLGATPIVHVYTGYIAPGATFVSDQSLGCGASHYNSYFTAVPSGQTANAVLATASTTVSFAISGTSGGACRSAIGMAKANGCFSVRTALLSASVTTPFLNTSLGLSLVGYSGLANASVGLGPLAAALGVGSVSQLASGSFTIDQLLTATASVLNNQGNSSGALTLRQMTAGMSESIGGTVIQMGQLLDVGSGAGSAASASVNVLSLVTGYAAIADGQHFINIPGLTVSVPNLSNVTVQLQVVSPPKIACNGATATTGQVTLKVTGQVAALSGGLLGIVNISAGTLTTTLNLAQASASVQSISCGGSPAAPTTMTLNVFNVTTASLGLNYSGLNVSVLGILGLTNMAPLSASVSLSSPAGTATLPLPQYYDPTFMPFPSSTSVSLPDTTAVGFQGLSGLLSLGNAATASGLINQVVDGLTSSLNSSVLPGIGLRIPGVEVAAEPTPSCTTPALAG